MSEHDYRYQPNISTVPTVNKPLVSIIHCGNHYIDQTYSDIERITFEDSAPSTVFNRGIMSAQGDILCFLNSYSNFAHKNVIEQVVNVFLQYPELGGIYGDCIINNVRQYYPAFSKEIINKCTINTPFFCRKEVQVTFAQHPSMYYSHTIKNLGQQIIFNHIPEPLFVMDIQ